MGRRLLCFECGFFEPALSASRPSFSPQSWLDLERDASVSKVGARSLVSLIPVSSMKKMKRAEQFSDDTDQPPRQQHSA